MLAVVALTGACDSKSTEPNRPPETPVIASPQGGATYSVGQAVQFQGSASDPEDGALSGAQLVWTSNLDGQIGTGSSFSRSDLSEGTHTITLGATDSDGASRSASVSITVAAQPPATPEINSPADGADFGLGADVTFSGTATDPEDGVLTGASLVWTSSLDGEIGTGTTFVRDDLTEGDHTITLTATDSDDMTSSASVSITVANQPPSTPVITAPADGSTVVAGTLVTFSGSATDAQDGALTGGSLSWTSDLDGQLGTGTSFSFSGLTVGVHEITLTATDAGGLTSSASVTLTVQGRPVAAITAPVNGASFGVGESVTFTGSASDAEDGALTGASLVWTSNLDGQIGTGASFNTTTLSAGTHTVTLTATDSDGLTGSAQVTISVVTLGSPTATITAPSNGAVFELGSNVTFAGSATDPEDGALTGASLVWTSDLDGQIGTGTTFVTSGLSAGTHTVTLTATDSNAQTGVAVVSFTVSTRPTAQITGPANGSTFSAGDPIDFDGTGTDAEDGALTGTSLVWTSSRDGQFGTGTDVSVTTLSVGTHTITLRVTDSHGLQDTDQITITVNPPGSPPTVDITSPAAGGSAQVGASVNFEGTATDPEDGALTGTSLVWTSSRDGQLGTGTSISRDDLSIGAHTITLRASDSDGWIVTDQITFTITNDPPVATITAPANGGSADEGDPVNFTGNANDTEDGALTGTSLVWTSSRDGQIGTGENFSTSSLSAGTHTITLTATDSNGATGTDQITFTVNSTASPIMVNVGSSASSSINVGQQTSLPIIVDMTNAGSRNVASIQVRVTWGTGTATYVSSSSGIGATINSGNAGSGEVIANWFAGSGNTSTFTLFNLTLEGAAAGSTTVTVEVQFIADEVAADLSGDTGTRNHTLTVN